MREDTNDRVLEAYRRTVLNEQKECPEGQKW